MKFLGVLTSVFLLSCCDKLVVGDNDTNRLDLSNILSVSLTSPTYYPTGPIYSSPVVLTNYPGERCDRKCVVGEAPRICYWEWHLETYQTMGVACGNCGRGNDTACFNEQCVPVDGVERGCLTINRRIPGTPIVVCQHDIIVVDVINQMAGKTVAIHWHGQHQRETPEADGVPGVTQCPIRDETVHRYSFRAETAGTHFTHAHSALHKADGIATIMIVRIPKELDPHRTLYDYDLTSHSMIVTDWFDDPSDMFNKGLPTRPPGIEANSIIINGLGRRINATDYNQRTSIPLATFVVESGKRYRFRYINSGSDSCPLLMQVQGHTVQVVATDGYDVEPRPFDTLISTSGERYDFILTANYTSGKFLIRVRQIGSCQNLPIESFALLAYKTTSGVYTAPPLPRYDAPFDRGIQLNNPNATCYQTPNDYCVSELRSKETDTALRYSVPTLRFFLGFTNYELDNNRVFARGVYENFENLEGDLVLIGAINNLSFTPPPFSLLTQPELVPTHQFCNAQNRPANCAYDPICSCTHKLDIPLGAFVELIIIDETPVRNDINHPFHMHGGRFLIIDMGQAPGGERMTVSLAQKLSAAKALQSTPFNSIGTWKDTASVPSAGFVKVLFRADNPGWWFLHCHFDMHVHSGMALVLKVGETFQMKPPPPGFPKCNNYEPNIVTFGDQIVIP